MRQRLITQGGADVEEQHEPLRLTRADGGEDCWIDIDDWDFQYQEFYWFDSPVRFEDTTTRTSAGMLPAPFSTPVNSVTLNAGALSRNGTNGSGKRDAM